MGFFDDISDSVSNFVSADDEPAVTAARPEAESGADGVLSDAWEAATAPAAAVGEAFMDVSRTVGQAEHAMVAGAGEAVGRFGNAVAPSSDWENDPVDAVRAVADRIIDSVDHPTVDIEDGRLVVDLPFLGTDTQVSVGADGAELHTDFLGMGGDIVTTFGTDTYVGVHAGGDDAGIDIDLTALSGAHGFEPDDLTHGMTDYTGNLPTEVTDETSSMGDEYVPVDGNGLPDDLDPSID